MTLQELESFGVTTGVKKVLKLLSTKEGDKKRKAIPASKPTKKVANDSGSKRIMDAFLSKRK